MKKTVVLCILDGWGIGKQDESNPIYTSKPPIINYLEQNFPAGSLKSSGLSVGFPWGEAGNSEVGHLTLGSGRVLYQYYLEIKNAINKGTFFKNEALKSAFAHTKKNNSSVHLIGLLTSSTTHAALDHLKTLIEMGKKENAQNLYLHLFTDGRDSPPYSAKKLINEIEEKMAKAGVGEITSLAGRYYGMNQNKNWQLTQQSYQMLRGNAPKRSIEQALNTAYQKNLTDEYVEPSIIKEHPIEKNDAVIFFNFREDGMKQLSQSFIDSDFKQFSADNPQNLHIVTMIKYREDSSVPAAFSLKKIPNTLGEVISQNNKIQLRVTETQRYAHITYFFNGLRERPFPGEYRIILPSDQITHFDKRPEMQAKAITDRVIVSLHNNEFDFILLNYANPDIIARTGNYQATTETIRVVDHELGQLVNTVLSGNHILLVTSSHGNAEAMFDLKTGKPQTKQSSSPVPFYLIGNEYKKKAAPISYSSKLPKFGMLSDIAPTILNLMKLPKPKEMTGSNLLDYIN